MKVLIPGASGLLGINMALEAHQQHDTIGTYHSNLLHGVPFDTLPCDLTQPGAVEALLEETQPNIVINCAALANVDACETQSDLAKRLNCDLPAQMAELCRAANIKFVHISTDAVFDGTRDCYRETDTPNPNNAYAQTKLDGENKVAARNPEALITRINIFGWSLSGKRSLAEWFYNNLYLEKPMKGFTDVHFCPLFVCHLTDILLQMAEKNLRGLYHVVGSDCLTKYDFGVAIARQFGLDESLISPTSVKNGGLAATRSSNLCLNNDKLSSDLGISIPGCTSGLRDFHRQFQEDFPRQLKRYLQ